MLVGVGKIVLDFYNNDKLALKHKNLEKLCKEIRSKFNVSILEVSDFDELERCAIGFAAVIPDGWKMTSSQSFIEKICKTIDQTSFARVISEDVDFLSHG